jgi:hypothetical protein
VGKLPSSENCSTSLHTQPTLGASDRIDLREVSSCFTVFGTLKLKGIDGRALPGVEHAA